MFKRHLKTPIDVFDLKVLIASNIGHTLGGRKLEKLIRLWCLDTMSPASSVAVNRFLMTIKPDESDHSLGPTDEKANQA